MAATLDCLVFLFGRPRFGLGVYWDSVVLPHLECWCCRVRWVLEIIGQERMPAEGVYEIFPGIGRLVGLNQLVH